MRETILVIAEHFQGKIRTATYEAAAFAKELREHFSADIKIIIIGDDIEKMVKELAEKTGYHVVAIKVPGNKTYNFEITKRVLHEISSEINPSFICTPHSSTGQDFAPGLAVELCSGCVTGVNKIIASNGFVEFARSIFGGKISAVVRSEAGTTVITVQPGAFKADKKKVETQGSVEMRSFDFSPDQTRNIRVTAGEKQDAALAKADVIISGGRGIGKKENLSLLRDLAALFDSSTVACSRPVCDMGWAPFNLQIGQTGATVAPKLYMACGISGSMQHLIGMKDSGFIVAVNTDPRAAIFKVADVCIVEDVNEFLPTLTEKLESR